MASPSWLLALGGEIALARPGGHAGLPHADLDLVELAVEGGGGKAEDVLAMQLVGDGREGRVEVVGPAEFLPAAAGRVGQAADALVRVCRDAENVALEA